MSAEQANTLIRIVQGNPENDLAKLVKSFRESDDPVWHFDRHVLDVLECVVLRPELVTAACVAGLSLLHQWCNQRSAMAEDGMVISEPYLIIDDDWLETAPNAPPPHVYICLAKGQNESVEHELHPDQPTLPLSLSQLLTADETYGRIGGAFEDEPSTAWLIKVPN
jgi:hypothetical protein